MEDQTKTAGGGSGSGRLRAPIGLGGAISFAVIVGGFAAALLGAAVLGLMSAF